MVSILILNHQRLVREGWSAFLSSMCWSSSGGKQSGVMVAGATGDQAEACRLAGALRPGVILAYYDLAMGLVRLRELHAASPLSRIIVVTPFCPANVLQQVRHLGVRGCLTTDSSLGEIEEAVVRVINGRTYLTGAVAVSTAGSVDASGSSAAVGLSAAVDAAAGSVSMAGSLAAASPSVLADRYEAERKMFGLLTKRELEVAGMLGAGKTSREVAAELGLSARTVEVHRQRILVKLQCRNTVHLAAKLTSPMFDWHRPVVVVGVAHGYYSEVGVDS